MRKENIKFYVATRFEKSRDIFFNFNFYDKIEIIKFNDFAGEFHNNF